MTGTLARLPGAIPPPDVAEFKRCPPYIQVRDDGTAILYWGEGVGTRQKSTTLTFDRTVTLLEVQHQLVKRLEVAGWKLGVDGWREPLDPTVGLLVTAHLYPIDGPWLNARPWPDTYRR